MLLAFMTMTLVLERGFVAEALVVALGVGSGPLLEGGDRRVRVADACEIRDAGAGVEEAQD